MHVPSSVCRVVERHLGAVDVPPGTGALPPCARAARSWIARRCASNAIWLRSLLGANRSAARALPIPAVDPLRIVLRGGSPLRRAGAGRAPRRRGVGADCRGGARRAPVRTMASSHSRSPSPLLLPTGMSCSPRETVKVPWAGVAWTTSPSFSGVRDALCCRCEPREPAAGTGGRHGGQPPVLRWARQATRCNRAPSACTPTSPARRCTWGELPVGEAPGDRAGTRQHPRCDDAGAPRDRHHR